MIIKIRGRVNNELQFAGVLGALGAAGKTGCLVVTSEDVERRLYFEGGALVAASSSATKESFGHLLVERAIIKEHNLRNAVELSTNQGSLLGSRLVEVGALSEDDVRNAVRLKVRDTIAEILDVPGGQYQFTDDRLPMKDKVPVFLDPGELMGRGKVLREGQPSTTEPSEQPSAVPEEPEPTISGSAPTLSGSTISEPKLSESTIPFGSNEPEPALVDRRDPDVSDRRDAEVSDRRDAASTGERSEELPDERDPTTPDRRNPTVTDRRDPTVNKMLEMFSEFDLGDDSSTSSDYASEPTLSGTESTLTGGTAYEEPEPTIRESVPSYGESEPTLAGAEPEPTLADAEPEPSEPESKPTTGSHARPTTGSYARPITGSYPRPTTGSHARPRTGVHDKPKTNTPLIGAAAAAVVILGGGYWLFFSGDSAEEPATGARLEVPKVETPAAQPEAQPQSQPRSQPKPPPKKTAEAPAPKRRQEPPKQAQRTPLKREKAPVRTATTPTPTTPAKKQEAPVKKQEAPPPPPATPQAPVKTAQNVVPDPPPITGSAGSIPPPAEAKAEPVEASGWDSAIFAPKRANVVRSKPAAPEATTVKAGDLVEPGPDVIDPVLIEHPELKFPKAAKKQKIREMVVRLRVLVDENGHVLEAKLDKPVGNGFDESAMKVARQARFIPATHGRVQVKMWTELPLHYRPKK